MKSFAKDDSCTQETDPGDNLRRHARGAAFIGKQPREDHKARGADCDQRVGSQTCHSLTPLAFEPDTRAQQGRHRQADSRMINRCVHGESLFLTS